MERLTQNYPQQQNQSSDDTHLERFKEKEVKGGVSSGCLLSTESCSVSDVLLNDDNSILCDPSNGTDCTLYLNSSQVTQLIPEFQQMVKVI